MRHLADFESVAMMIGAIVGAGVLGIPFVVAQSGVLIGVLYILILGVLVTYVHLMIGEVTLRTQKKMQVPGLARKYLGTLGGWIMGIDYVFFSYMAIVAYIVASGDVLAALFPILSAFQWSLIFFSLLAIVVYVGLNGVKVAELVLAMIMLTLLIVIMMSGIPHIDPSNLLVIQFANVFVPFGVIMFAMGGASAVPEMENLLPHAGKKIERTLIIGTLTTVLLYMMFTIVVVGVTGLNTTSVATIGLGQAISQHVVVLGALFALIAMSTSFLTIGLALRRVYEWDCGLPRVFAWVLALGIPLIVYMLGARDFIKTLALAGALGGGLEGILFVCMFWQARKKGDIVPKGLYVHFGKTIGFIVIATFMLGMVATIWLT